MAILETCLDNGQWLTAVCCLQLDQFHFEDAELNADQEVVMVRAELKPLVLESMNKFHDKHDVSRCSHNYDHRLLYSVHIATCI